MVDYDESAFPQIASGSDLGSYTFEEGLTKREMIAAMVLQGVMAGAPPALHDYNMHVDAIDRAEIAVRHADALLARLRAEPETEEVE